MEGEPEAFLDEDCHDAWVVHVDLGWFDTCEEGEDVWYEDYDAGELVG